MVLAYYLAMTSLIVGCSDGRVAAALTALQQELGVPDADRVILPGGPLALTRPGMERRVAVDAIRSLVEAHDVRAIHLVSHQDCSAYERVLGGMGFDQQELLERDLRRVKSLLETTFPGVDVAAYMIPWRESGEDAAFGPAEPVD